MFTHREPGPADLPPRTQGTPVARDSKYQDLIVLISPNVTAVNGFLKYWGPKFYFQGRCGPIRSAPRAREIARAVTDN
ncbi:hypothetical protein SBA4_1010003 [Candidatus Sulfopaludibacter sp. SbA4]|nr:hypothetical protein SBA4_1010003 [Candidatus Sulfopaludibacter sp. SbA4]